MTTLNILVITQKVTDIWEYKPFGGNTKTIRQIINDASKTAKAGVKNTAFDLRYDSHYPCYIKNVQGIDDEMYKKIANEMRSTLIDCVAFDSETANTMQMISIFVSGKNADSKVAYIINNNAYSQHSHRVVVKRLPVGDDVTLTALLAFELLGPEGGDALNKLWSLYDR